MTYFRKPKPKFKPNTKPKTKTNSNNTPKDTSIEEPAQKKITIDFKNDQFIRTQETQESKYPTVKVNTKNGVVAIPGCYAKDVEAKAGTGDPKLLHSIAPSATVVVDSVSNDTEKNLELIGIAPKTRIKVVKPMPFLYFKLTVNDTNVVVITESIAAMIIGSTVSIYDVQLSFVPKEASFLVKVIAADDKIKLALKKVGICVDATICVETVEPRRPIDL
jgi:hypothetical protein